MVCDFVKKYNMDGLMFLYDVISQVLTVYVYIVIARAVLSWFVRNPYNPIFRIVYGLTEPVLSVVRRIVPSIGGIDISPIILILVIEWFIKGYLLRYIFFGINSLGLGG